MELKKIIADVVREVLPDVVRDMVRGELGLGAPKLSLPMKRRKRRPGAATERGVEVGQRWEGKTYTQAKGRIIEIVSLGKDKVIPKVVKSPSARSVAKPISYEMLTKAYSKVE